MKPRNKKEVEVQDLYFLLPQISLAQKKDARKRAIIHVGHRTPNITTCMTCGNQFKTTKSKYKCTCGYTLDIIDSKKRSCVSNGYYGIIDTISNYQVIRVFYVSQTSVWKQPSNYFIFEVCCQFINEKGRVFILSHLTKGSWNRTWNFASTWQIRNYKRYVHNCEFNAIYSKMNVLPIIKRNGFDNYFADLTPLTLFNALLGSSHFETLWKAKQYYLAQYYVYKGYDAAEYIAPIKCAIRNNYIVTDRIWVDHISTLRELGKDIHNAKYVCPDNLSDVHLRYIAKLDRLHKKQEFEKRKQLIQEHDIEYQKWVKPFLSLVFEKDGITINVLKSVQEFYEEGSRHKHCIFLNKYYQQIDTLCFKAIIDGTSVENIAYNLPGKKVDHAAGYENMESDYHDKIIKLINNNKSKINKIWHTISTSTKEQENTHLQR
jgi:hypothetical protein